MEKKVNVLSDSSIYRNDGEAMGPIRVVHYLDQCLIAVHSKFQPFSTGFMTWDLEVAH